MSLSRSPSPLPGGGWSSPGLTPGSGSASPRDFYPHGPTGPGGISWAAAKAKSEEVRGYPSFSTRNSGFFSRQKRKISASLPRFSLTQSRDYREKEKLGRGRWQGGGGSWKGRLISFVGAILRRTRFRLLLLAIVLFICYLNFWTGRLAYVAVSLCAVYKLLQEVELC
jgi:mannan polymerase II complex MNN10 subunit